MMEQLAAAMLSKLGYEQLKALEILAAGADIEASVLAKRADCSWNELLHLGKWGLIDLGMERVEPNSAHPKITDIGKTVAGKFQSRKKS
jgi:hypothetical protein